jgi:hypothetical protein
MSLNNIQLPPVVLQELFKKTLVNLDSIPLHVAPKKVLLDFLGNNKRLITIIVNNDECTYLPDEQLTFLLGILSACSFNLEDVAIVNIHTGEKISYQTISKELKAEKIFLFGVNTAQIELPLQIPHYQPQQYNKQVYLSSPSLDVLQNDKAQKTKLWLCLKKIFSIA